MGATGREWADGGPTGPFDASPVRRRRSPCPRALVCPSKLRSGDQRVVGQVMANQKPRTIGELRRSEYQVLPVKEELRKNLIAKLRAGEELFPGIVGYEETVLPQVENAI